jgi:uncharacterized SAM-binding protein YcdF (DUF218 family)
MEVILSKYTLQYIYPLTLFLWLVILAVLIRYQKKLSFWFLFISFGVFWIFSTPVVSSHMVSSLEQKFMPVPIDKSPIADAIVVLGGSVAVPESPRIDIELTGNSDRILHAARLYRAGKAPVVIATGGAEDTQPEAYSMKALLAEWGVPKKKVIIETESLNTYRNAVNSKPLLDKRKIKRVLLVTSAIHMPRALATFRTLGINAIPSPTDYMETDRKKYEIKNFLPDIDALGKTSLAVKEYLGAIVYRWRGWIK